MIDRVIQQVMAMSRVLHLWNEWEIQILVLVSFALQVLLLSFAWMRRCSIHRALRILLWLMYLLAEYTATYALCHMSIGGKAGKHQPQLMAFWDPFLLMHLGGQANITAYAIEDSQLWLRHLLTFAVQALGAGYVLYKYISGPLVTPAVLILTMGVLKNVERVAALSFSRLEMIRRYLNGVPIKANDGDYPKSELDDESVLHGAHELLYICMGQFVDDKIYPTKFQNNAMNLFREKDKVFELVELQLSLMYDIFYTKATVIYKWYGCGFRTISLVATAMAFYLFQFSTAGKDGYNRVDVIVTYILVIGALVLEAASVLRAMGSTWTCDMIRVNRWGWLHSLHVSLRQCVRIAQARRWSDSIGQLNLMDSYCYKGRSDHEKTIRQKATLASLWSTMHTFWRDGSSRIPEGAKKLMLAEIERLVKACEGEESVLRSYRGQCTLKEDNLNPTWSTIMETMEFDTSILTWHIVTHRFLRHSMSCTRNNEGLPSALEKATRAVSDYMMFLLVERPYMLPSPVRPTLHLQAKKVLRRCTYSQFMEQDTQTKGKGRTTDDEEAQVLNDGKKPGTTDQVTQVLNDARKLADQLLSKEKEELETTTTTTTTPPTPKQELLRKVFGVWVEMLCYAAHHCSRESHVRQLSNGGEFITVVWLLTTAEFNRNYYDQKNFKEREHGSIWNLMNSVDFKDFLIFVVGFLAALIVIPPVFAILLGLYILCLPFSILYLLCNKLICPGCMDA